MARARWSRTDQVGLEALLGAVVGIAALGLAPRVVAAVRDEPVRLTTDLPEGLVRPVADVEAPLTGTVVLQDPSAGQQLLALLPGLLEVLAVAVGAWLLLGVVRALREGDPFTPGSARRLTWLAVLVGSAGVGVQLVEDLTRNALLSHVDALGDHLGTSFTLPFWPLIAALLLAFLAEVFSRGSALRAEVEGLV